MNLNRYFKDIKKYKILSYNKQIELFKKIEQGIDVEDSKNKLIVSNLSFVILIVKKFSKFKRYFFDLIQEGNIGLIKAIDKFNYRKGYKFTTYAKYWIKHFIFRFIYNKIRIIRLPCYIENNMNIIIKTIKHFIQEYGEVPTIEELSLKLNLGMNYIKDIKNFFYQTTIFSLNIENDNGELVNLIEDEKNENIEDVFLKKELYNIFLKEMEKLSEREQKILKMRYGLNDSDILYYRDISEIFGVSHEIIRLSEKKSLNKIRKGLKGWFKGYNKNNFLTFDGDKLKILLKYKE